MTSTIARHEFIAAWRDGRFRWAAAIVLALLLTALAAGWAQHESLVRERAAATDAERTRWLAQPEKNPHSAAHYGIYAFRPRQPTAYLDNGVEPYVGSAVWLEAHKQNDLLFKPAEDASVAQRFGDLTAATVLQLLLPLLIILLGFGVVVGERERGTLHQVLSTGVSPRRWILGKTLGVAAALSVLMTPAVVVALGMFAFSAGGDAGAWPRLVLLGGVYAAYLTLFILGTLAVSALAASSRVALGVLLAGWIFNGLLAPRGFSELAAALHPTPSAIEVKTELRARLRDPHGPNTETARLKAELMRARGVTREEDLHVNEAGIELQASEKSGYQIFDEVLGRVFDRAEAQNRFMRLASYAAPLVGVQALSTGLAGTDFAQHRDFVDAAEQHRRVIQKTMNDDMLAHPPAEDGFGYTAGAELWAKVPPFRYVPPTPGWVLRLNLAPLVALSGWIIGAVALLVLGIRRLSA